MLRKCVFIVILTLVLVPAMVLAEDSKPMPSDNGDKGHPSLLLPEIFKKYQGSAENEISQKEDMQFLNQDIKNINYNKDGTINTVLYNDDLLVSYSYKYDDNGKITKCALETDDVKVVFKEEEGPSSISSIETEKKLVVKIYSKEKPNPEEKPGPGTQRPPERPPVVVLYYPATSHNGKINLNDIARKPIKFNMKEISLAISKTVELKNSALRDYEKNTSIYYSKIEDKLKAKLNRPVDKIDISSAEKRRVIDETVAQIYSDAEKEPNEKTVREFLTFEKGLRNEILIPEKKIYEGRVSAALAYVYNVIDKLLKSRLALYLDVKEDKIDAIINLPKNENPKR